MSGVIGRDCAIAGLELAVRLVDVIPSCYVQIRQSEDQRENSRAAGLPLSTAIFPIFTIFQPPFPYSCTIIGAWMAV
jgi:hypothetical protein